MTARRRILVVDDEPTARQVTCAQLVPEGYDLRALASGAEALEALADPPVDVVVCDVMMPGSMASRCVGRSRPTRAGAMSRSCS